VFKHFTSQRVIFPKSASTGSTVLDVDESGEAAAEIRAIAQELKEFL